MEFEQDDGRNILERMLNRLSARHLVKNYRSPESYGPEFIRRPMSIDAQMDAVSRRDERIRKLNNG